MRTEPVLDIRDLTVEYPAPGGGTREVLRSLTLAIARAEHVALVGESGSGKSVAALAALGLVAPPGRVAAGRVTVAGIDLATAGRAELRRVRGGVIGLVFQEPSGAFNPVLTIGSQIAEAVRAHRPVSRPEARRIAHDLLTRTALDQPRDVMRAYPHQLSGGQVQRAMVALALAGDPSLLIADEPTTALDLHTQARILELLRGLAAEDRALLLISHDLAVVRDLVDRVVVLFAGDVVEVAATDALLAEPLHPYTRRLLDAARLSGESHRGPGGAPGRPSPTGCRFSSRCELAEPRCHSEHPPLAPVDTDRAVRCPVVLRARGSAGARPEAGGG